MASSAKAPAAPSADPRHVPSDTPSADPPSLAELAEQTRRSAPPPAPKEDHAAPYDAFTDAYDPQDLRYPFDSILPATLDARALEDLTPAPFDLVNGRPSSFGFVPVRRTTYLNHFSATAGLLLFLIFALAVPRVRLAAPPSRADLEPHRLTPAQAARWAAEPFTVDVPVESPTGSNHVAAPIAREAEPMPLHHFDIEAAAVALAEAKSSLSECTPDDEAAVPVSARVSVTFSPKGNVTTVQIDPPAEVGNLPACVVNRLRAVRVAAFAGTSITVRTTVGFFRRRAEGLAESHDRSMGEGP
jgi:hypothetical protein